MVANGEGRGVELVGDIMARLFEARDNVGAMRGDAANQIIARARQSMADLLALFAKQFADARASFANLFSDNGRGMFQIARQCFMRARNRLADTVRIDDNGFSLG